MFLNDVHKKDEIRNVALQDLRTLSIKFRLKKPPQPAKDGKKSRKVFGVPLQNLPTQTVTLNSGQQLIIPKIVHEMCSFILSKVCTEGLFRKGGSKSRQNEIKLSLDAGCYLGDDHHEIDVASVLKTFLRDLPEPLFPVNYHDLFLKCAILQGDKLRATLLACLLLPCGHLNILAYIMQFLNQVTQFALHNKMDSYNLAVVMVPNLVIVEEKLGLHAPSRINKFCEVFKLLVENATLIGLVPDDIIERIALSSSSGSLTDDDITNIKKKKKRRSGSLTRMFNGLKKIVSSKSTDDNTNVAVVTPDLLLTPCMTRSAKKRKYDGAGFSMRKKKEILNKLPQSSALCAPYTPMRTPVNNDPNPKKVVTPDTRQQKDKIDVKEKEKKSSQWLLRAKTKSSKQNDETASVTSRASLGTKAMLERRWSQVSQVAGFRKSKKRNSCGASTTDRKKSEAAARNGIASNNVATIMMDEGELKATPEPEYVKISRTEYEEIKCRVSEIERRISIELDSNEPVVTLAKPAIENVQNAYEQTLVQIEQMSPTTDQLAKRLSRELKIRRSAEQKIIRSPSARKIGTLRRRSRESDRSVKLNRHQSWHVTKVDVIPKMNPQRLEKPTEIDPPQIEPPNHVDPAPANRYPTRSSSFHGDSSSKPRRKLSESWKNGENFFDSTATPSFDNSEKCRASLIRLRNQNAGMVLAKARLFDDLVDSDGSNTKSTPNLVPRVRTNKVGAARAAERQSYRIRALKAEERRAKKSMSPKRRTCRSPNNGARQQRLQVAKGSSVALMLEQGNCVKTKVSPLKDFNFKTVPAFALKNSSPCATPRSTPHIKRPFNVKSPKRLNRTPLPLDRTTPLKVIVNNRQQY